jgi:hypothetical protein
VRAFHLCYERSAPPLTIANWNCVKLKVGKHIRHQDLQVFSHFWSDLSLFLKREKYGGTDF